MKEIDLRKVINSIPEYKGLIKERNSSKISECDKKIISFLKAHPWSDSSTIISSLKIPEGSVYGRIRELCNRFEILERKPGNCGKEYIYNIRKEFLFK